LDAVLTSDASRRVQALREVMGRLKNRVRLQEEILQNIPSGNELHNLLGGAQQQRAKELRELIHTADADLSALTAQLNDHAARLAKELDARNLRLFEEFAQEKVKLIAALKNEQLRTPTTSSHVTQFRRLDNLVRTGIIADKYQLLVLEYATRALALREERKEVQLAMAQINVTDYLNDLGDADIDGANLISVMNHSFAQIHQTVRLPPAPQLDPRQQQRQTVTIQPSRGLGGVYYMEEIVSFTITSTKDCDFILLHRDASGKVTQLCPNKHSQGENHLKANVPLKLPNETLPYQFVACEPPGLETLTLYCVDRYRYRASIDRTEVDPDLLRPGKDGAPSQYVATRGIRIEPRRDTQNLGLAYDKAYFATSGSANAVKIETFIRIKQR